MFLGALKKVLFFGVCLVFNLVQFDRATAFDLTFDPIINVAGWYNSNYYWDVSGDELDTYYLEASPSLIIDSSSDLIDIRGMIRIDVIRYLKERQLNRENQYYSIGFGYRPTSRSTFKGEVGYLNDFTLTSTENTSIGSTPTGFSQRELTLASERKVFFANTLFDYQLSEMTDINIGYNYSKKEFDNDQLSNNDLHNIFLFTSHRLNNSRDIISIGPEYKGFNEEFRKTDYYTLSIDWFHLFSKTLSLEFSLGGRYTNRDLEVPADELGTGLREIDEFTFPFELSIEKKTEKLSAKASYQFKNYPSDYGGTIKIQAVNFIVNWQLTERLRLWWYSLFYWPLDRDFDFDDINNPAYADYSSFYGVEPAIFYKINDNLVFEFQVNWGLYYEADRQRTRAWIGLRYDFPFKW